jgi:putative heme-binding domain-containing protein
VFEVFAEGTSNPWGVDFDEHGQCFVEACVIPHLFHMVQGGRFTRQAGTHFNPHTYDDIKTIADHVHWAGNQWSAADITKSAALGGGHAHAGFMIYQGDNWPAEFRGKAFMNNIHGACLNMDVLTRRGSGFVGSHAPNPVRFNDAWSQVVNLQEGPDGGVYLIDWYDKNQCHHNNSDGHDRSNGRIFKISHGEKKAGSITLAEKSTGELIELAIIRGDWIGRHARRMIQEAAVTSTKIVKEVEAKSGLAIDPAKSLRWLWALHASGGVAQADESRLLSGLRNNDEYVRAWNVQLVMEGIESKSADARLFILGELARLAREDKSPVVRLYLASAAQRLPIEQRWDVLGGLVQRAEDAFDHNLPLMVWYAAEPLPTRDVTRALKLAESSRLSNLLAFMVRRTAALNTPEALTAIATSLTRVEDAQRQSEILNGLRTALQGQRRVALPQGWDAAAGKLAASRDAEVRVKSQSLSLIFGNTNAIASLRQILQDRSIDPAARKLALDALVAERDANLPVLLRQLLPDTGLRGAAIRALAQFDDPQTPDALVSMYTRFSDAHQRDARNALATRTSFAQRMLQAVESGQIPKADLTADVIQQLRNLKSTEVDAILKRVWGVARESDADKQKEIARYKGIFHAGGSQPGDSSRGRAVFNKVCAQCHTVFGSGSKVGPDLTGSNRADLDYILQNMVDPNAVVPNDYLSWDIETKDDRTLTGLITAQTDQAVTLTTANETLTVARAEIATMKQNRLSMMPDGLLLPLSDQEVRDLIIYLRQPSQVPLYATAETPAQFFNGKDLAAWDGNSEVWRVDKGEIVGQSATGLKHNEFLKSQFVLGDFRFICEVKLTPNGANSGIQFRSEPFEAFEMRGCQADIGQGWWGKVYEENGRELISTRPGDSYVRTNDWNSYEILAVGNRVRTALNGKLCADLDDPKIARNGIIGLQVHSGGPTEVRFRNLQLELSPKFELRTVK